MTSRRALTLVLALAWIVPASLTACSDDDDESPPGKSGAGGVSGAGGKAGTAGKGGTNAAGSSGAAGAAGSAGAAGGTGGAAGSAGAAGAAGSAGTSGNAGTAGVSGSGGSSGMGSKADCTAPVGAAPNLKLTVVGQALARPVLAVAAPGDPGRLYVVEQAGRIQIVQNGAKLAAPFLDTSMRVVALGDPNDERGLLGLAFHPDYAQNGRFFVHFTARSGQVVGAGGTIIAEFKRSTTNPSVADPASYRPILTLEDPEGNHNGGSVEFGSDGMLYIALGDGGGAGDLHGTIGNGQSLNTLFGKILRVDVNTMAAPKQYGIPTGNLAGGLPELWDYGLRNPYRMSFDVCTGDLYIGDVGQGELEEIDVEPKGQGRRNYGWRLREGNQCYNPASNCDPQNTTIPAAAQYARDKGCAVVGGYVYRGSAIPGLRGTYFYGDHCSGRVFTFQWQNGAAANQRDITTELGAGGFEISSFGQDENGNVFVVDHAGRILRIDAE